MYQYPGIGDIAGVPGLVAVQISRRAYRAHGYRFADNGCAQRIMNNAPPG